MSRYFFDLWEDGDLIRDDVGTELPDLARARRVAVDTLGSVIRSTGLEDGRAREFLLSVSDGGGRGLFSVAASVGLADTADACSERAWFPRGST